MITLIFETANLVEAPPAECGAERRRCFLGPGTRARVHVTVYGPEGASKPIAVSGATGEIFYDGQPTGSRACGQTAGAPIGDPTGEPAGSFLYAVTEPFATGRRAGVRLSPAPPLTLSRVDKVVVGHDRAGAGPEWCLKSLSVQVAPERTYVFAGSRWLTGEDLELTAPLTETTPDTGLVTPPVTPAPPAPPGAFGASAFDHSSFV